LGLRPLNEEYLARLTRHALGMYYYGRAIQWKEMKSLSYWVNGKGKSSSSGQDWLTRSFGFKKLAILASQGGKIFGVDVLGEGNMPIVWERIVVADGQRVEWKKLLVLDEEKAAVPHKTLLAIGEVTDGQGNYEAVAFRLDATTGQIKSQAEHLYKGRILKAFSLPAAQGLPASSVVVVDTHHKVHIVSGLAEASPVIPSAPVFLLRN